MLLKLELESKQNKLSQAEDKEFFTTLYEDMTDPVKLAEKKRKDEVESRINNRKKDYGL